MVITISNNIRINKPTSEVIDYCKNNLVIDNPDYLVAQRLGRYVGKMQKKLELYYQSGDDLILPFGTFYDIYNLCKNTAQFINKINDFKRNNLKGGIKLYDYQERAVNDLIKGKNGVLIAPCGSGKTNMALEFIKRVGGKALWLTHTSKLLEQSLNRAKSIYTGDFGTITEGKINIGKDITFATVQTMRTLDTELYKNEFSIVIVDECQHCVGSFTKVMQFYKVVSAINCRYKIGVSATIKNDQMSKTVYSILGKKLHTISSSAVGEKIIKAKHIRVDNNTYYDIEEYCENDGMINYTKLINLLSIDTSRNNLILDQINYYNSLGKKQLVLCSRVQQVKDLSSQLNIDNTYITGGVNQKKRDYNHQVIIATFSLAKEGLDIPDLDVVHFCTPQKDRVIVKQSAGRVERNIEGKQQPLIIDYVDTSINYCEKCYKKRVSILK